jgi:hypothetical protein
MEAKYPAISQQLNRFNSRSIRYRGTENGFSEVSSMERVKMQGILEYQDFCSVEVFS